MSLRIGFVLFVLTLAASGVMLAPSGTRSEPLTSPPTAPPLLVQQAPAADDKRTGHVIPPAPSAPVPEIITDLSRLPPPVARTRERILAAARSGELQQLADLMNETTPIFSFTDDKDPVAFWKAVYPDSDGVEALSILITILETGFVQVDAGTPHEMYVWPYFVRMSLPALTSAQKVELFRIVTGADYKDMLAFGVYAFYRLGIGPDGTWQFFVAGD
ncbi:MAG: hypothetical protein QOI46_6058 [Alphaproteobacteria bacterium]|jgi:hypothetical protein|nr:hypothetical protein [Alphaproteobacteria bacterium]